jgi:uncharacterized MAPEG superfamily protein
MYPKRAFSEVKNRKESTMTFTTAILYNIIAGAHSW